MVDVSRSEAATVQVDDPRVIRALAHPARVALLARLNAEGPGTATECAAVTGLSPSATSYHLRALAECGLIEEVEHSDGRKHLWRSLTANMVIKSEAGNAEVRAAGKHLLREVMAEADRRIEDWLDHAQAEPQEWQDALTFVNAHLSVTPSELRKLLEQIRGVLAPYHPSRREEEEAPDSGGTAARRSVSLTLRAVPGIEK